jgi:hypothetical protein
MALHKSITECGGVWWGTAGDVIHKVFLSDEPGNSLDTNLKLHEHSLSSLVWM